MSSIQTVKHSMGYSVQVNVPAECRSCVHKEARHSPQYGAHLYCTLGSFITKPRAWCEKFEAITKGESA